MIFDCLLAIETIATHGVLTTVVVSSRYPRVQRWMTAEMQTDWQKRQRVRWALDKPSSSQDQRLRDQTVQYQKSCIKGRT